MSKPIKVLLVEDDVMIVKMYQTKFKMDGFEFITALNGEEGMKILEIEKPDIVLLDIMMPKMNGLEMLRIMKSKPEYLNVPAVMLTNLGDRPEDVEKCKELGAEDYWVKANMELEDITGRIKNILEANKLR